MKASSKKARRQDEGDEGDAKASARIPVTEGPRAIESIVLQQEALLRETIRLSDLRPAEQASLKIDLIRILCELLLKRNQREAAKSLIEPILRENIDSLSLNQFLPLASIFIEISHLDRDFTKNSTEIVRAVLNKCEDIFASRSPLAFLLSFQAADYLSKRNQDEAERALCRRIELCQEFLGEQRIFTAYAMHQYAHFLLDWFRFDEAFIVLKRARASYESAHAENDQRYRECLEALEDLELGESIRNDLKGPSRHKARLSSAQAGLAITQDVSVYDRTGPSFSSSDVMTEELDLPSKNADSRTSVLKKSSNALWLQLLEAENVPESLRAAMMAKLRLQLARDLRPKWSERRERGGSLATVSAPAFLRRVHPDYVASDGTVDNEGLNAIDPKLLKATQQYVATRKNRGLDMGDAKGLNFKPMRPPTVGNAKASRTTRSTL